MKARTIVHSIRNLHWSPVVATACMLYNCYMPGQSFWNLIGIFLWFIIAIAAIIKVELWAIKQEKGENVPAPVGRKSARILWALITLSILSITPLPEQIVFRIFRPQLEEYAHAIEQKGTPFAPAHSFTDKTPVAVVGCYPIVGSETDKDGAVYLITKIDKNVPRKAIGFAFNATHDKNWKSHARHHIGMHLDNDWFIFEKD